MKIKNITIENFRTIKHLDLDCSENVNAFIGDNGAGKSTVLEAIALLYSWLNAKLFSPMGRGRQIRNDDIRIGSEFCFLSIEVEHKGMTAKWSLLRGNAPAEFREKQTNLKQLEDFLAHIREFNEDERYLFSIYGVNRNISSVSVNKTVFGKNGEKQSSARNSFATTSWKPFFNWYFERENEENRMKARFNMQYHDESLDTIRECLKEVFPGYRNLRVEDRPTRFVVEKNGSDINFERLSDGEKCYITLVLDIARRLSLQNAETTSILDGEQVILIDELDLHLHPSWQLKVISNLGQKFPHCQFFVTSHSPLVLSSLGVGDRLVVLRDGRELELSEIPYGDNGDYILKRFFGLSAVRNPEVQQKIDNVAEELCKVHPDLKFVEQALNEFSEKGIQYDEAVKMHLLFAQKKKAHAKD